MTTLRTREEVEKEFDEMKSGFLAVKNDEWWGSDEDDIKDFVHSIRQHDLQVIKEWAEKQRPPLCDCVGGRYNITANIWELTNLLII